MSGMDHDQAKKLYSDFVEGELSAEQAEAMREHVEGCAECNKELESLRETMRSLSGLHHIDPPELFVSKVEKTIRRRSRGRFFGPEHPLSKLPFEWISLAIIIALLAVYLLTLLGPDVRSSVPATDGGSPAAAPAESTTGVVDSPDKGASGDGAR